MPVVELTSQLALWIVSSGSNTFGICLTIFKQAGFVNYLKAMIAKDFL